MSDADVKTDAESLGAVLGGIVGVAAPWEQRVRAEQDRLEAHRTKMEMEAERSTEMLLNNARLYAEEIASAREHRADIMAETRRQNEALERIASAIEWLKP